MNVFTTRNECHKHISNQEENFESWVKSFTEKGAA